MALAANERELPYRKLPGSRQFFLDVRAQTMAGEVIAVAAPFPKWEEGYRYLYMRSLYPLTGRVVLPLIDDHDRPLVDNLARANVIAAYRTELSVPHFVVVWRSKDGVLMRRTP